MAIAFAVTAIAFVVTAFASMALPQVITHVGIRTGGNTGKVSQAGVNLVG